MAMRSRAYYRKQRAKHIRRKKNICLKEYGWAYYEHEGSYSKGKIHCSCPLCTAKTKNKWGYNFKPSELKKIKSLEEQEKEYMIDNI